ncbi:hypothetical protein DKX38_021314 [Salix brachista]|uniref:Glutaredoxin domain-containing protein n=3 Tax=Salix TaxID=40685 RepID=A0A5N5KDI9_9ROSI|nr:hypothetical protein DKX38_021314 [Salix brachista]
MSDLVGHEKERDGIPSEVLCTNIKLDKEEGARVRIMILIAFRQGWTSDRILLHFRLSCIKIVRIFTWKRIGANNWINPGSFSTSAYAHKKKDMDMVKRLVADRPVVIFSRSTCCMSHSIKTLISSFGANPTVFELDQIPNGKQIEKALLQQLGCQPSVPAVFIGQEFVGGDKQIMSLQVKNELAPLLMKAGAIWI